MGWEEPLTSKLVDLLVSCSGGCSFFYFYDHKPSAILLPAFMTAWTAVGQNEQFSPYRAVGFKVLWYGNVMIGGEFGHHAFVFGVPQDTVQVWKVLEDVKAILGEMSCCPSTQLGSLWGEKINKPHRDLSHPRPPTQHNPPTFFHFPPTF